MNIAAIAQSVLTLAEKFSPLLDGTPAGPIVEVGKIVLDLVDQVKETASEDDAAKLAAVRDELEPKVIAHLDKTIDSLG